MLRFSRSVSIAAVYEFIAQMKNAFRIYTEQQGVFVDTFTIERDGKKEDVKITLGER